MVQEYRAKDAPPPPPPGTTPPAGGPHKYKHLFHAPPVTGPGGMVPMHLPEEWAEDLGRHLEANAMWSREELIALAGPGGVLRPTDLPAPTMRHDPPASGPRHWLNPGLWVPVSAPPPAPAPTEVDLSDLTDEQAEAARIEAEAIQEALRRREIAKARQADADPHPDEGGVL